MYKALIFTFNPTNNEAEFEALIRGVRMAKQARAERLRVKFDSQLVVRQVNGTYEARGERMLRY